jgi:hypothetical protein
MSRHDLGCRAMPATSFEQRHNPNGYGIDPVNDVNFRRERLAFSYGLVAASAEVPSCLFPDGSWLSDVLFANAARTCLALSGIGSIGNPRGS